MKNSDTSIVYSHDGKYFDLETLTFLKEKPESAIEIKREAHYASFFGEKASNQAIFENRKFELDSNRTLVIRDVSGRVLYSVPDPEAEIKLENVSGNTSMFATSYGVISILRMEGERGYRIMKYNKNGETIASWNLPHTKYRTEGNTRYSQPYLYFRACTDRELVFSSIHSTGPQETIVLNLQDGSQKKSEKTIGGVILKENEVALAGLVTYRDKKIEVEIGDHTWYISNTYGYNTVKTVLKENVLYVASYHWISTGSALHAYDAISGKLLWEGDVKQMNASHSEYYNTVYLTLYKDKLIMEGEEAYGNYLQILDAKTGKSLYSSLPW